MINRPIYIIVQETTSGRIQNSVNDFIGDGYIPLGGVSILDQHAGFIYVQSMVIGELLDGN